MKESLTTTESFYAFHHRDKFLLPLPAAGEGWEHEGESNRQHNPSTLSPPATISSPLPPPRERVGSMKENLTDNIILLRLSPPRRIPTPSPRRGRGLGA